MEVFKITLDKFSGSLSASGAAGRWNSKGNYVIYTSGSRALACLENIVHRSGEGLSMDYKVLTIKIPDELSIDEVLLSGMPANWEQYSNYHLSQDIGDNWLQKVSTAVLKVPSAIITKEYNYLLNPAHIDFKKINIIAIEGFIFDSRIKK